MDMENDNVMAARRILAAIEAGDEVALREFYTREAVQVEHPNRLKPQGDRRGVEQMMADLKRGKSMLLSEHYDVESVTAFGDSVALQVVWRGVVNMAIGKLQPGDEMVCESGIFLQFQGGRVTEQHNYDCFAPF